MTIVFAVVGVIAGIAAWLGFRKRPYEQIGSSGRWWFQKGGERDD